MAQGEVKLISFLISGFWVKIKNKIEVKNYVLLIVVSKQMFDVEIKYFLQLQNFHNTFNFIEIFFYRFCNFAINLQSSLTVDSIVKYRYNLIQFE